MSTNSLSVDIDDATRSAWYKDFLAFHRDRGTPLSRLPQVGGSSVDLCHVYHLVVALGGFDACVGSSSWQHVVDAAGVSVAVNSRSTIVRKHYLRFCYPYERVKLLGLVDVDVEWQSEHPLLPESDKKFSSKERIARYLAEYRRQEDGAYACPFRGPYTCAAAPLRSAHALVEHVMSGECENNPHFVGQVSAGQQTKMMRSYRGTKMSLSGRERARATFETGFAERLREKESVWDERLRAKHPDYFAVVSATEALRYESAPLVQLRALSVLSLYAHHINVEEHDRLPFLLVRMVLDSIGVCAPRGAECGARADAWRQTRAAASNGNNNNSNGNGSSSSSISEASVALIYDVWNDIEMTLVENGTVIVLAKPKRQLASGASVDVFGADNMESPVAALAANAAAHAKAEQEQAAQAAADGASEAAQLEASDTQCDARVTEFYAQVDAWLVREAGAAERAALLPSVTPASLPFKALSVLYSLAANRQNARALSTTPGFVALLCALVRADHRTVTKDALGALASIGGSVALTRQTARLLPLLLTFAVKADEDEQLQLLAVHALDRLGSLGANEEHLAGIDQQLFVRLGEMLDEPPASPHFRAAVSTLKTYTAFDRCWPVRECVGRTPLMPRRLVTTLLRERDVPVSGRVALAHTVAALLAEPKLRPLFEPYKPRLFALTVDNLQDLNVRRELKKALAGVW